MFKKYIILVCCFLFCVAAPPQVNARVAQHSYTSFYEAVGNKFGSLDRYFRDNFLFDVRYSSKFAARLKSWLESDEQFHFEVDHFLEDSQFVNALQHIAGEYAKKEWRFRNNKRIKDINGIKSTSTQHEQIPFSKTDKYFKRRFIVSWPYAKPSGKYPGHSYYRMYLLAGDEFLAADPRYPIHQAGGFSVGIPNTALVLSVAVDFYAVDQGLRSNEKSNSSRPFYWLVLPSWRKIAKQSSEQAAAEYVKSRLQVWLPT